MSRCKAILCALMLSTAVPALAEDAQVMILGTWHFANPGADLNNVDSVDVLKPDAQAELGRIVQALAGFKPDRVFVEWPAALADERYAQYRAGTLEPDRNEVVQIGFRLAAQLDHPNVYGIDVDGTFPFGPVAEWAKANGKSGVIDGLMKLAAGTVAETARVQRDKGISVALRELNVPERVEQEHSMFYAAMLDMGKGEVQPGVDLNVAWYTRNLATCARLLQSLPRPGGRAVVLFGAGHAHWLRRCVIEAPGVELVEPNAYLPVP